jgi:hypothetical protein
MFVKFFCNLHIILSECWHNSFDFLLSLVEEGLDEHLVCAQAFFLHHEQLAWNLVVLSRFHQAFDHATVGNEVVCVSVGLHLDE